MQDSVHKLMQNLFIPSHGLHRGLASGSELTSLCRFKYSQDIGFNSSTTVSFAFLPASLNSGIAIGAVQTGPTTAFPNGPTNPFVTVTGATQTLFPSPFATTNPSTGTFRVVSFQLKIINTAAAQSKGGDLMVAYHPGIPSTSGALTTEFTRSNIDQLEWCYPVSGDVAMVVNWVPNDNENILGNPALVMPESSSAILGYMVCPSNTGATFRFEYDIGIEYIPSAAYRPFVERQVPTVHPDSWYHINKELSSHWDRWVIMPYMSYMDQVKLIDRIQPGYMPIARINGMGSIGTGGNTMDADIIEGGVVGEAEKESTVRRFGKAALNAARDTACYLDPALPFCGSNYRPESQYEILVDRQVAPPNLYRPSIMPQ